MTFGRGCNTRNCEHYDGKRWLALDIEGEGNVYTLERASAPLPITFTSFDDDLPPKFISRDVDFHKMYDNYKKKK